MKPAHAPLFSICPFVTQLTASRKRHLSLLASASLRLHGDSRSAPHSSTSIGLRVRAGRILQGLGNRKSAQEARLMSEGEQAKSLEPGAELPGEQINAGGRRWAHLEAGRCPPWSVCWTRPARVRSAHLDLGQAPVLQPPIPAGAQRLSCSCYAAVLLAPCNPLQRGAPLACLMLGFASLSELTRCFVQMP